MIGRIFYLKELARVANRHVIKVVTGIRGCGKTTLLEQFKKALISNKIDEKQITYISLDDDSKPEFRKSEHLLGYIETKLQIEGMNYIFIDDAYLCNGFQEVVNTLFDKVNTDIYISGSNYSAITEGLKDTYVIKLLPFSFSFPELRRQKMLNKEFLILFRLEIMVICPADALTYLL